MRNLILAGACLLSIQSFAIPATDTVPSPPAQQALLAQSYQPVFRVTAKDIEQLPFTSLMEVLNNMFPFVADDPPIAAHYTFLIDGRLLVNPNAINPSQIALIEFYPVAFNIANASMARKGSFVITTKKDAKGLSVRSQTGVIIPTDNSYPSQVYTGEVDQKKDLFTHQEIGYGHNSSRLMVNTALSFTRNANPAFTARDQQTTSDYDHSFQRIRFSNLLAYQVSKSVQLTGGVSLNSQRQVSDYQHNVQANTETEQRGKDKVFFWTANAALNVRLGRTVSNSLVLEHASSRYDSDLDGIIRREPVLFDILFDNDGLVKFKEYAVTNTLKGAIASEGSLQAGWELLLRYYQHEYESKFSSVAQEAGGMPLFVQSGMITRKERSIAAMPRLSVGLHEQLFITAGVTYDSWKLNSQSNDKNERFHPYAGIRWTMKKPAGDLYSLNIHSTYSAFRQRTAGPEYLDMYQSPQPNGIQNPSGNEGKAKAWITGLDAGFGNNNKLVFSFNYRRGTSYLVLTAPLPGGPGPNETLEETKHTGLSAGMQLLVADKQAFSLRLKGLLFYEVLGLKDKTNEMILKTYNPILNNGDPKQWRGSVQANMTAGKFFAQAIALLRFKEKRSEGFPPQDNFSNNNGLTFLLAGYTFPLRSASYTREIKFSVQGRNLLAMKQPAAQLYYGSRYVGVGVTANL
jgi:hypothetical protein